MLVVVGVKEYHLESGTIDGLYCDNCNSEASFKYSVYSRYPYLTLIPLFPVDKTIYVECCNCKNSPNIETLPIEIRTKILETKNNCKKKPPLFLYAGSVAFIIAIVWGINYYIKMNSNKDLLFQSPKKGDVYNVKIKGGFYSTMKLVSQTKDSFFWKENIYQVSSPFDYDEIDMMENYIYSKGISKKELNDMYNDGKIFSISRGEEIDTLRIY